MKFLLFLILVACATKGPKSDFEKPKFSNDFNSVVDSLPRESFIKIPKGSFTRAPLAGDVWWDGEYLYVIGAKLVTLDTLNGNLIKLTIKIEP